MFSHIFYLLFVKYDGVSVGYPLGCCLWAAIAGDCRQSLQSVKGFALYPVKRRSLFTPAIAAA